jgi:hypothetical protein
MIRWFTLFLLVIVSTVACAAEPTPTPLPPSPTADPYFAAQGTGEPRGAGYWQLWNSCAPDNRSETAAANGGRQAGWFIMDDLLQEPGILLGELVVATCADGLHFLQGQPLSGSVDPDDVAYPLAAQLLAAQLNLATGAEHCPAVDDAVRSAQLLLVEAGFDGAGKALGPGAEPQDRELAEFLTEQLANYNIGRLCQ